MPDTALTDTSNPADVDPILRELTDADDALDRARSRVAAVGEADLVELREAYDELTDLFDRYEAEVTGDGDFQTFIEFQGKIGTFTEELSEQIRHREVFEEVDDLLQQRRLTESDWERVRETLAPVREDCSRLADRADARDRYREARTAATRRIGALDDRIEQLESLRRLGDADLDAPTERLRDPIETYDELARDAFETFRREASAREVLALVDATAAFPLVPFESPPGDLLTYVREYDAGAEPLPQLREYADYSQSKLDHYVEDPAALERAVATHQTYLRRLDADPLTIGWPPPEAAALRFRCRELTSVLARFDADEAVQALREVRALPRETDYGRLRESAQARAQLGPEERERLASGAVADELAACRDARERLSDALDEYPSL